MVFPLAVGAVQAGSSLLSSILGGLMAKKEQNDPLRKQQDRAISQGMDRAGAIPGLAANAANLASSQRNQALVNALQNTAASRSGLNTLQTEQAGMQSLKQSAAADAMGQAQAAAAANAQSANALGGLARTSAGVENARAQTDATNAGQFGGFAQGLAGGAQQFLAPQANLPKGNEVNRPSLGLDTLAQILSGKTQGGIAELGIGTDNAIKALQAIVGNSVQDANKRVDKAVNSQNEVFGKDVGLNSAARAPAPIPEVLLKGLSPEVAASIDPTELANAMLDNTLPDKAKAKVQAPAQRRSHYTSYDVPTLTQDEMLDMGNKLKKRSY